MRGTRRIPLRARDGRIRAFALVDAADFEWLSQRRWSLHTAGYATARVDGRMTLMHRLILGLGEGDPREADHVNRNRLDCRRENLRALPPGANVQNVGAKRGALSRFRGVAWKSETGKWVAVTRWNGKQVWLGTFDDELEAAEVAADFRRQHVPYSEEALEAAALAEAA